MELQSELPNLEQFATLSPIPGFTRWLDTLDENSDLSAEQLSLIKKARDSSQWQQIEANPNAKELLRRLCAQYLYQAKRKGKPLDPVARFHLRNGASIGKLNWAGDSSDKGISQATGMMVNYCYNLKRVEQQHEKYVNENVVAVEKDFLRQLGNSSTAGTKTAA